MAHAGSWSSAGLVLPQTKRLGLHLSAEWCSPGLCPGVLQGHGAEGGVGRDPSVHLSLPASQWLPGGDGADGEPKPGSTEASGV